MKNTRAMYIAGFAASLILTLAAYQLVQVHLAHQHLYPSDRFVVVGLIALAIVQLFVQLIFFLRLGREHKPHWNTYVFIFAAVVVLIIVIGSLWIMSNLNYRMMYSPRQINQYMNSQGDL